MALSTARNLTLSLALLGAPLAAAEQWPPESHHVPAPESLAADPLPMAAVAGLEPLVLLPPAADADAFELRALELYNATRPPKLQDGFSRQASPRRVRLAGDTARDGGAVPYAGGVAIRDQGALVWSGKLVVEEAHAFRVRLDDVEAPRGTTFRVYPESGPGPGPVGLELLDPDGGLWLPPVEGSTLFVEARVSAEVLDRRPAAFTVGEVMEIFEVRAQGLDPKTWTDCDIDGTCVSSGTLGIVSDYRNSVARLSFVDGAFSFLCSGGLVNDQDPSDFRPFLLTANHCFSSQASASSLVAYFDYRTSTCNGSAPSLGSVPQVSGSTLLASNSESDFTFVELSANPTGSRFYLGWTTFTPTHAQTLYRLAHPQGTPQKFSTQEFLASGGFTCGGVPRPDFHYSEGVTGSTAGGSSGSPVIDSGGHIVGQLLGVCHVPTWDDCDYGTYSYVDGAFATTFGYVSSWLTDDGGGGCTDDGFEPDDTCFGSFIGFGSPQVHQHCDEDWVWFNATAGATYVVETSNLSAGSDTTLALHQSCGPQLAFDDDGGGGLASRIQFTAGATAAYDVRVGQFADDYESGEEYTVTVTCIANCAGGGVTIFTDGFESGNLSAWSGVVP